MLGFQFTVEPSRVSEEIDGDDGPGDHVRRISHRKANAVAQQHDDGIVLGADTIVVLDDDILEKPVDAADAERMLRRLAGRTHEVYTGLTLIDAQSGSTETDIEVTQVNIRNLTDDEVRRYAATTEPLDKAGAYAAQGRAAVFIQSVNGCFYNVVGLPLARFWGLLEKLLGHSPWDGVGDPAHAVDLVTQRPPA